MTLAKKQRHQRTKPELRAAADAPIHGSSAVYNENMDDPLKRDSSVDLCSSSVSPLEKVRNLEKSVGQRR